MSNYNKQPYKGRVGEHGSQNQSESITEIRDRCRRIETRLASFLENAGVLQKVSPIWVDSDTGGYVRLGCMNTPLSSCIRCIPSDVCGEVEVYHEDRLCAVLFVE